MYSRDCSGVHRNGKGERIPSVLGAPECAREDALACARTVKAKGLVMWKKIKRRVNTAKTINWTSARER